MKRRVRCPNGHEFKCDAAHMGRRVLCPKPGCGKKFRLTSLDEEIITSDWLNLDAPVCPSCRQSAQPGAVLCTNCGIDLRTGRPFETSLPSEAGDPQQTRWSPALVEAPPDPKADFYRRMEVFTNLGGGAVKILVTLGVAAIAAYLATSVDVDVTNFRWRLRLLFILGWAPTWWIVFAGAAVLAMAAIVQLVTTGKVEFDEGCDG